MDCNEPIIEYEVLDINQDAKSYVIIKVSPENKTHTITSRFVSNDGQEIIITSTCNVFDHCSNLGLLNKTLKSKAEIAKTTYEEDMIFIQSIPGWWIHSKNN